jgi:hypothetical protein
MAGLMAHASEAGHWYTKTGEPMYEIKGANGNMRPTTLRDARKLDLVPSVTTIIKQAAAPGLERWKINQTLLAALTLPRIDGEPEDAYLDRIIRDSGEQARKAAERGTQIHAAIQGHFEGQKFLPPGMLAYVHGAEQALEKEFGETEWICEHSFAHPLGFGGKTDLHINSWRRLIGDAKTKEFDSVDDKKLAWDDHAIQLAAYREGLRMPDAVCFNLFISTTVPGLCHIHIWSEEEMQRGWKMFRSLLSYWQAKNKIEETV